MKKIFLLIAVIGFIGLSIYLTNFSGDFSSKRTVAINGIVLPQARPVLPFVLQGANNGKYSEQDLKGHWTLIFFGYLTCPDICPTTLATLAQVFAKSEFNNSQWHVWFISVDPSRDKPDNIQQYVEYFNPKFIGLTGNNNQIKQLTAQFAVPYFIQADENNYLVDHGSQLIVVNPKGQYHAVLTTPHQSDKLSLDLTKIMTKTINY